MQAAAALACPSSAYAGDEDVMDGLTRGWRDAWLVGLCVDRLTVLWKVNKENGGCGWSVLECWAICRQVEF